MIAFQSLFNRESIQIILPNINLFTNMISNNDDNDDNNIIIQNKNMNKNEIITVVPINKPQSLDFYSKSKSNQYLHLFTSNNLLTIDKLTTPSSQLNIIQSKILEPISRFHTLIDIFPSIDILLTELCLEPLADIMNITQKQVVNHLIEPSTPPSSSLSQSSSLKSYNLQMNFEFMKKLFFIGDSSIFNPLFEFINDQENFKILLQNSNEMKIHSSKLILDDVINRLEENIYLNLPPTLTTNQININHHQYHQKYQFTTDRKEEQFSSPSLLPSSLSNKSNIIYNLLDSLFIEVHYSSPLNYFFDSNLLVIYNHSFNRLIKLQSSIWCCEIVWKHVISMSSPFQNLNIIQIDPSTSSSSFSHTSSSYERFQVNLKQLFRNCFVSLQSFLHLIRSLKQFYLYEIHVILWEQFIGRLKSSETVEDLLFSHEKYLLKIQSFLSFESSLIELILLKGLKAICNLEEINNLMEIEQQASLYYNLNQLNSSNFMIETKLKQVLKEFSSTRNEIQKFTDIIIEICLQSPSSFSVSSSSTTIKSTKSTLSLSEEEKNLKENRLKYYWANSLRVLIGL